MMSAPHPALRATLSPHSGARGHPPDASDIDYFYTSRLPGEPAGGVDGIHTHPLEPRSLRVRFEITAR